MSTSKEKKEALQERMLKLGILEKDLVEKFILGSGSGGQKINKTSSCVYLHHLPSGIEIKCQRDRSRELNRFLARRELCDQIEAMMTNEKNEKQKAAEKIRRQKQRRTRRQKQKMIEEKRSHSERKAARQHPSFDE